MPARRSANPSRRRVFIVALATPALALAVILYVAISPDWGRSNPRPAATTQSAATGMPVRLKIPKATVDAPVESVGLTPDGAMDVPKGPANTAWYQPGPRPGQTGSAVIDGHFDLPNNSQGVFHNLNQLSPGDEVSVEDERGVTITFVVRESRKFDPAADATVVFTSNDGRAHLNLITCDGSWNTAQQSYSNRLVVFTDRE